MTEVVILELVLDPAKMQVGAKAASDALEGVGKKAQDAEKQVKATGNTLNAAFAATGGGVQIAQGITQTAAAFGQLNTAAGLFGASRTLLEIGRTADDFNKLQRATGQAAGAWGLLGLAWRTNPIGLIATGIGIAAAGMSLFADSTERAASNVGTLGASLSQIRDAQTVAQMVGIQGPSRQAEQQAYLKAISGTLGQGIEANTSSVALAHITGLSEKEILQYAKQGGRNVRAEEALEAGEGPQFSGMMGRMGYRDVEIDPGTQREIFKGRFQELQEQNDLDARNRDQLRANELHAKRIEQSLEKAAQYAGQIGASVGDAAADMALAGVSLSTAVQGLLSQLARQGFREGAAGLLSGLAKGFGKTAVQQIGDGAGNSAITIIEGAA